MDVSQWFPAVPRGANESPDDWKWLLRSGVNRPILRWMDQSDVDRANEQPQLDQRDMSARERRRANRDQTADYPDAAHPIRVPRRIDRRFFAVWRRRISPGGLLPHEGRQFRRRRRACAVLDQRSWLCCRRHGKKSAAREIRREPLLPSAPCPSTLAPAWDGCRFSRFAAARNWP